MAQQSLSQNAINWRAFNIMRVHGIIQLCPQHPLCQINGLTVSWSCFQFMEEAARIRSYRIWTTKQRIRRTEELILGQVYKMREIFFCAQPWLIINTRFRIGQLSVTMQRVYQLRVFVISPTTWFTDTLVTPNNKLVTDQYLHFLFRSFPLTER